MSGDSSPAPDSCVHNLHRVGDGRTPRPEATDLCRNAIGVFHMADCPLTLALGLHCSYYEASPEPHPTTGDLELEAARDELQRDFLGWRYRRRARWLTKPKNLVPVPLAVESAPEPEEVVPEMLAMRAIPVAAPAEGGAPADPNGAAAPNGTAAPPTLQPITTEVATTGPVAVAAPERYPGQRRSEERLAKKRARLAARDAAAAAAAKAAQIAAVTESAPPAGEDEGDDDEFGEDLVEEAEPVDEGPKTVEEVLAALPDAPVGAPPQRRGGGRGRGGRGGGGGGGGGGSGPGGGPGDGRPRHRRRRGRRGRGGGGGGGGGGPRPGGPPQGPRPPG